MTRSAPTSSLGFGCASLGSRIEPAAGLRALAAAHERGVRWFDLAPSYGDGTAESIFASFAATRRDTIAICTKVGIEPPQLSPLKRMVKPLARTAVRMMPGLRSAVAGTRQVTAISPTPERIRASIERSLTAMRTDHVDVLALHDPDPATLSDEAIEALSRCVERGEAKAIGVTGTTAAVEQLARRATVFTHLQTAATPVSGAAEHLIDALEPASFALHSVQAAARELQDALKTTADSTGRRETLGDVLTAEGFAGAPAAALRRAVLQASLAFAEEQGGVVLVSMFNPQHLADNIDAWDKRVERAPGQRAVAKLTAMLNAIADAAATSAVQP